MFLWKSVILLKYIHTYWTFLSFQNNLLSPFFFPLRFLHAFFISKWDWLSLFSFFFFFISFSFGGGWGAVFGFWLVGVFLMADSFAILLQRKSRSPSNIFLIFVNVARSTSKFTTVKHHMKQIFWHDMIIILQHTTDDPE